MQLQYLTMHFSEHHVLKYFVRDTLGCSCPDDVFNDIVVEQKNQLANSQINYYRILVGKRLLIYLLGDIDCSKLQHILALATHEGMKERDNMKYNRFRLVLHCDNDDMIQPALSTFESIRGIDEKAHMHFIASHDADALFATIQQYR